MQVADSGIYALRSMKNLKRLGLAGCSGISNGAVGSVSPLTSLEELNLEWCSVGVKGGAASACTRKQPCITHSVSLAVLCSQHSCAVSNPLQSLVQSPVTVRYIISAKVPPSLTSSCWLHVLHTDKVVEVAVECCPDNVFCHAMQASPTSAC